MPLSSFLHNRTTTCELCAAANTTLESYSIPPFLLDNEKAQVAICDTCITQLQLPIETLDANYWRCLEGSIWSEVPAVQALSFKLLTSLSAKESWAAEAASAVFLEQGVLDMAAAELEAGANKIIHKDAYGAILEAGDTINLTENLNVKGTNFIAPKGTKVIKIKLVPNNAEQIEGKINGDTIVILTKFVRKNNS